MNIEYKIKTANAAQVNTHLTRCSDNFIPSLAEKVDIPLYAKKIADHAITFEAWDKEVLAGLVAAYFNDGNNLKGFITNVSTLPSHNGKGIASELLNRCFEYARENNFSEILLEVNPANNPAIQLYTKFGFASSKPEDGKMIMKKEIAINNK